MAFVDIINVSLLMLFVYASICGNIDKKHVGWGGRVWLTVLTGERSIVSNKSSQVQRLVVNVQLLHTADKLPGTKWKVVWYVGNSAQKQWTSQVQRPEGGKDKEEDG